MGDMDASTARKHAGHIGFLTTDQEQALAKFKDLLRQKDLDAVPNMHDDATLLRFLRARSFDPPKALKQYTDTVNWRKKHDVDKLYASFDVEEFEMSKTFYPKWTGRRDKTGTPLYVYRIASLTSPIQAKIHAVPPARRYERIVVLYEFMCRFSFPLCTSLSRPQELEKTPVSNTTSIIDLEGVSLRQIWNLRNHLQEASALATANHPETLGTVIVVNSPSFFPTVWNWIKGYFDEGTRQKVHVLSKNMQDTLISLVDPEHLPKSYGGDLDWAFEDEPNLDVDAAQVLGGEGVPKGPVLFVDGTVARPS